MITSRIMTNRFTSPTALQTQPRGMSTSNKAKAFAADPVVQQAFASVSKPATANNPAVNPFNQFAGQAYTPISLYPASPNAGKTTSSGAPDIKVASQPVANAWNYTGPAAKNPYFSPAGSAPDTSTVKGFEKWFSNVTVYSGVTNGVDHVVNPTNSASAEGAQEALRLVQMYEPGAKLESVRMGEGAGPYLADGPTYSVVLPDGTRMNAGAILNSYYHSGAGVSVESDLTLAAQVNAAQTVAT